MKPYNPYYFLYLIPIALIAGVAYYVFSIWDTLNPIVAVLLSLMVAIAIALMSYNYFFTRNNTGSSERGDLDQSIRKILKHKGIHAPENEVNELIVKANAINSTPFRRAEKAMRIQQLIDLYLKEKSESKN